MLHANSALRFILSFKSLGCDSIQLINPTSSTKYDGTFLFVFSSSTMILNLLEVLFLF